MCRLIAFLQNVAHYYRRGYSMRRAWQLAKVTL